MDLMKKTKLSVAHIINAKYCDSYAGLAPSQIQFW